MKKVHPLALDVPESPRARRELIDWLLQHPIWNPPDESTEFDDCVDIDFLPYINPETGREDSDPLRNTVLAIRVEAGPDRTHDIRLDYWAPTVEIALIQLASRVHLYYDDQGKKRPHYPMVCASNCDPNQDGYCTTCGFLQNGWNYWMSEGQGNSNA